MNENDVMSALQRRADAVDPGAAPLAAMTAGAATVRRRRGVVTGLAAVAAVAIVATTVSVVGLGGDEDRKSVV